MNLKDSIPKLKALLKGKAEATWVRLKPWLEIKVSQAKDLAIRIDESEALKRVREGLETHLQKLDTKKDETLAYLSDADRIEAEPIAKGAPITLYAIIILLFLGFVWAVFSELDKVVSAPGRLISTEPNIVLQAPDTAEIKKLNAMVGQRVKAGEVLLTLDPTVAEADRKQIEERVASLAAQIARLEAEEKGKTPRAADTPDGLAQMEVLRQRNLGHAAKMNQYEENINRLRESLSLARSEVSLLESRLRAAKELETMNTELVEKKFQSRKALIDSTDRRLEIEQQLSVAKNRLNEHSRNLKVLESERNGYVSDRRQRVLEELYTVRQEYDSLNQQLIKANRKTEQISLVSPVNAIVLEVAKLSVGSMARLAEPLITLVPLDANMLAEVQISTSEISGVRLGQETRVKVAAYPFQRYGYLKGRVDAISPDSIAPPQGSETQERAYIARVTIVDWDFGGAEKAGPVLPGMTLTAEIITGQRSVMSYLIEPVMRTKEEALNER
jgi:hemolysin D